MNRERKQVRSEKGEGRKKAPAAPSHLLLPKRRFPEFRDAPGWEAKSFAELYSLKPTNTFSRDQLNYDSGAVKNIHYGDIHTKFQALFDIDKELVPFVNEAESLAKLSTEAYCKERDMVFADASEDLGDVGKSIELINLNGQRVLSGTHTILARPRSQTPAIRFGGYLFRSDFIRRQIKKEAQGAKVLGISGSRLANMTVCIPSSPAEQRKIADCLGSLDDWIAAAGRKLAALRDHKRGLMQQLFPQPGQSQPQQRFPEFRDGPKLDTVELGDVVKFQSGGTPSKSNPHFWNGSIPWVSAKSMKSVLLEDAEDHISETAVEDGAKLVPAGTVLMLIRGMTLLKDVPVCMVQRPMCFNQDVKALHTKGGLDAHYLLYLLLGNKNRLLNLVGIAGHGTGRFNTDELKSLDLMLPTKAEQQKIAACLTALDTQITAQAAQLQTLQEHKRGLMQQLFPERTGS